MAEQKPESYDHEMELARLSGNGNSPDVLANASRNRIARGQAPAPQATDRRQASATAKPLGTLRLLDTKPPRQFRNVDNSDKPSNAA